MKIAFFLFVSVMGVFSASNRANAQISAYLGHDNKYHPIEGATKLDANGSPFIYSYKDENNNWRTPIVVEEFCSQDPSGHPIACPTSEELVTNSLKNYVPLAEIGQANGVAGLDPLSRIGAPIGSVGSSQFYDSSAIPILAINPQQSDQTQPGANWWNLMKPHSVVLGGASPGVASQNDYNADGQLYIVGSADGVAGHGCLLCVLDTNSSVTHESIGLNTAWVNGPAGIASYGIADNSIEYIGGRNREPDLLLDVSSYSATQVILKTPLTAQQMGRIHYGQYILTNSIDASLPSPNFGVTTNLPAPNFYASVVVDVADSTHIDVKGWAVPGAGNAALGQIPGVSSLDTSWTNFGRAVVGIGGLTNTGIANWRMDISQTERPNSFVRGVGFAEFDITNDRAAGQYGGRLFSVTVAGAAPTADSWVWNLNAPQYPMLMYLGVGAQNWGIKSPSFMFHGNGGISPSTPDFEMAENSAFADSTDDIRLISYLHRNGMGTAFNGTEMYLGGYKGGTAGTSPLAETHGGQGMGAIGWDVGGNYGSISLCGSATTTANSACGLRVDASGNVSMTGQILASGNLNVNAVIVGGGSIISYSDGHATFKGSVSASLYHETLSTPASSTASCSAGDFSDDANYHYVCTATNTWKRVALSTF